MVLVQGEIRTNTLDSPADLLHKTRGILPTPAKCVLRGFAVTVPSCPF
jgi:hypothetical protein